MKRRFRRINYDDVEQGVRITLLDVADSTRTGRVVTDASYVAACDVGGAKRLNPKDWREIFQQFDKLYQLTPLPVVTIQLRFDGCVTELKDEVKGKSVGEGKGYGLDNLLYSTDADFLVLLALH